jgi:hypothetical protein
MPRPSATICWTAVAVVSLAFTQSAGAQILPQAALVEHRPPIGVEVSLGVRADQVRGGGFDAFSDDHALAELMLSASYRVAGGPDAGLLAGVVWNHGNASSTARGSDTSLDLDRLVLSLRAQRVVWRRLSVYARLAPGAVRVKAQIDEASAQSGPISYASQTTLAQTHWAFAVDGAAGAALRVGELARPREHVIALWLTAEGGYSVAGGTALSLRPSSLSAPGATPEPVRLGSLTPGGAFMNFAAGVTF